MRIAVVLVGIGILLAYIWIQLNSRQPLPAIADPTLKSDDLVVGSGEEVHFGSRVFVHYTGWLTDGKKFDSSLDRNQPFEFTVGRGQVITGWDQGILGMKVGGKRKLTIPAELGYGKRGSPPNIPPDAILVFEIELLKIH